MKKLMYVAVVAVLLFSVTTVQGTLVIPDGTLNVGGEEIAFHREGAIVTLPNPGDYNWWHGCSPTAAGMVIGHYDGVGYDGHSYNNLVPGGPAENSTYGTGPYLANNAIASPGHISDFYGGGYDANNDDVAQPWHSFNCLADFMGTSQDSCGNNNGSTAFYYFTNGAPFHESDAFTYGLTNSSGMYGIGEYINYAGYDPNTLYNQYIDTLGLPYGFTFAQYMAEIDAGRPVVIHVENHSMYGYGYDSSNNSVILHDTWTAGVHSMTWGGSYSGLDHFGVTVLTLVPEPATIVLLGLGALSLVTGKKRDK